MTRGIWGVAIGVLLGLTACVGHATYPLITPLYPRAHQFFEPFEIDSLQPTFRWKLSSKSSDPDTSYDLIIYDVIKTEASQQRLIGKVVYYRQGLKEAEHKIEEPLKPNTEYAWSVRIRQDEKVSDWANYNYWVVLITPIGGAHAKAKNYPFLFVTPEK